MGRNDDLRTVCYEFYLHSETEGDKLIGILPERRSQPERTGLDAVVGWFKSAFGDALDLENVYFVVTAYGESEDGKHIKKEEILRVTRNWMTKRGAA